MPKQTNHDQDQLSVFNAQKIQMWFLGIIAFAVILFLLVQAKFLLISLAIAIMLFSLTSDAYSRPMAESSCS